MTPAAQLAVLGPVEVVLQDGRRESVGGPKQRQLLALLLLHRNRPVPAQRLVNGLWGERPPQGGDVTLRSHISHLRRWLATAVDGAELTTDPAGYRLTVPSDGVDVDRFESLIGLAQEAFGLGRADRATELTREALALWRDRPWLELEGLDAADAEAARLEEMRLVALEVLAAAELAAGRHRDVVAELEGLVAAHPFRERFAAQLMVALYRSGRQADALAAYTATRELLADELGLDPGPELQDLAQAVLRQDPVLLGEAVTVPEHHGERRRPRLADPLLSTAARTPLVGRDRELTLLRDTWAAVGDGGRQVVLLSGEAGAGKTRLLAELVKEVNDQGDVVLVGRCEGAEAAYRPIADALSSPDAQPAVESASEQVRTDLDRVLGRPDAVGSPGPSGQLGSEDPRLTSYAAVRAVLAGLAREGPTLLVIEDGERIDRASALLLSHLARRLPDGLCLLVAYRDPPGGRHPPLLELLGEVAPSPYTQHLALPPFDERSTADLVALLWPAADPGAVHRLWEHTGGNPYFVSETARALAAAPPTAGAAAGNVAGSEWRAPAGVREALRHRLLALPDPVQEILPAAAVLGREVDFAMLAAVLDRDEDEVTSVLGDAVAAGFLVESGTSWVSSYAFPHDLMREAVLGELGPLQARRLHLRAAQALISRADDGAGSSAAVARHLRDAGPAADAAEVASWCRRAAQDARAQFAWDEAIGHAEAAVRALQDRGGVLSAEAAEDCAHLHLRAARGFDRAVELLETALREYVANGDTVAAGRVHSRLGGALTLQHSVMDVPRALDHFAAAERLLPDADRTFHLQRGRSQAAMYGVRTSEMVLAGDAMSGIAEESGRTDLAVMAGWCRGWSLFNEGRLREADDVSEEIWSAALAVADPYLGWAAVQAPALRESAYLLDPTRGRAWCRRGLGQPRFTTLAHSHDTVVDQLGLALALSGQTAGAHEATASLPATAVAARLLLLLDGRWEEAEEAWTAASVADEEAGDLHDAALNLRWRAWACRLLGDRDRAVALLERAVSIGAGGPQRPTELAALAELAVLRAEDDSVAAAGHLARCDELLAGPEDWRGLAGQVLLARAAVAEACGDTSSADSHAGRAVAVFGELAVPWHRADALVLWSGLLERRGDPTRAAQHRDEAERAYLALGAAEPWLRRTVAS